MRYPNEEKTMFDITIKRNTYNIKKDNGKE